MPACDQANPTRSAAARQLKSGKSISSEPALGKAAERLLAAPAANDGDVDTLIAADLARRCPDGAIAITSAGLAHLARLEFARTGSAIDPFLAQHIALDRREVETDGGRAVLSVDVGESPLVW